MSKMMIYATLTAVGGNIENVWGSKMRVKTIDPTDKDAVEQAKADGWSNNPQDIIEQIEAKQLKAENKALKSDIADLDAEQRITELEADNEKLESKLSEALTEVADLTEHLAVYENAKDTNNDGRVSYDEMTSAELQELLKQRGVEFKARDNKDTLIKLAQDSE